MSDEQLVFNGFAFPILSTVDYVLDGKDKKKPSQMFIADKEKRFLFSFDVEMKNLELMVSGKNDYEKLEILYEGCRYCICYPRQEEKENLYMGYFSIEMKDEKERVHNCLGQLSISPPVKYIEGMKKYEDLKKIIYGIKLCEN